MKVYSNFKRNFSRTFQTNFYEILRIDKFSSIKTVKEAYEKILESHTQDDKDLMQSVNLAYETLANEESKDSYDMFIRNDPTFDEWRFKDNVYCRDSARIDHLNKEKNEGVESKKNSLDSTTINKKGHDIFYDHFISISDLFANQSKSVIKINSPRICCCEKCQGTRSMMKSKNNIKNKTCYSCHGIGKNCKLCKGIGYIIKNPCITCNGSGVKFTESFDLKFDLNSVSQINNNIVKFIGEGSVYLDNPIDNYSRGDLYVKLNYHNTKENFECQDKTNVDSYTVSVDNFNINVYYEICLKRIISNMGNSNNSMLKFPVPFINKGIEYINIDINSIFKGTNKIIAKGLRKSSNSPNEENSLNQTTVFGDLILNFKILIPNGDKLEFQDREDLNNILNKIN